MPTGTSPHELHLFVYYQSLYYLCNASQRLRRRSTAATNQARCSNLRDFSVYAPSCFLVTTGLSQVKGRSVAGALKLRRKSPPFVSQVLIFSLTCDRYQPSVHSSVAGRPNFEDLRRYAAPPETIRPSVVESAKPSHSAASPPIGHYHPRGKELSRPSLHILQVDYPYV